MSKIDMKDFLNINIEKVEEMTQIKKNYIEGKVDAETTKKLIKEKFDKITPDEFAYSEQKIKDLGFDDNMVHDMMNGIIELFRERIVQEDYDLPEGHPIKTYISENTEVKKLIAHMILESKNKFIKNKWLELYDKLYEFNKHLSRKQHQLFSKLEEKGFDRPSKIMWTFDNAVRDSISLARKLLREDKIDEFNEQQEIVWDLTLDIMSKEEQVLYPTSLKLITEEEFRNMRSGDDEIGYCLIEKPQGFYPERKIEEVKDEKSGNDFMKDLASLLSKYDMVKEEKASENQVFDVSQGKLTLDQINLIYKHLPIDLSYVDENEIVKFYSDTKHRVFPRSAGVIGRDVKNCHPRESVSSVVEIIEQFRNGNQDEIDFWIEMNGKFIYIYYVAVRDDKGNFRGVLEMMQDVTKIRSLTGSRKLVTWENEKGKKLEEKKENEEENQKNSKRENKYNLNENTIIGDLINKYPYIKEFMPTLSPVYKGLLNPVKYAIMSKVATLDSIASRGGFELDDLISKIEEKIELEENK